MIGRVLGSYLIVDKLGEGGMGAVYLAEHQRIARRAAVKVLRPELANNDALVERFFAEARATSLIRHPGIVEVLDCAVTDGCAYIVMELLEGSSLADHLRAHGPLREERFSSAIRITEAVAAAVGAAHARQIIHRDLKPDNVFLVALPDGSVVPKILDFGIAKLTTADQLHRTSTGAMLGTPIYMSPEQCRGAGRVDHRTDVYALGCVLFELVTGRPPFVKEGAGELIAAHLAERPPAPSSLAADVPPALDELVAEMLAKSADERPATMADVGARLRPLRDPRLDGQPLRLATARQTSARPATKPLGTSALPAKTAVLPAAGPGTTLGASVGAIPATVKVERRRRAPLVVGALGLIVVAGAGLGYWQLRSPPVVPPPPAATVERPPVAPVEATKPPAPPAAATKPAALPEWITITLEGAPSGTTAFIDGERQPLPLRLRRGAPPRAVRFEAPGYTVQTATIDGSSDRALALPWIAEAAKPAPKRPARRPSTKPTAVSTAPASGPATSPLDMKLEQ